MNIKIYPKTLSGSVIAPPSKSILHRLFIASALSGDKTVIHVRAFSDDVRATVNALKTLGADISLCGGEYVVTPISKDTETGKTINAESSASTLRFLLPVSAVFGGYEFTGSKSLSKRPISELLYALKGVGFTSESLPLKINGKLISGEYNITGEVSSQYISGLLFALPLLDGDSKIIIHGSTQSKPYIDMTIDVLNTFKVQIQKTEYGYYVKGNQEYISPKELSVEGDYSGSAFFIAYNELFGGVTVTGLKEATTQGDKKIYSMLKEVCLSKDCTLSLKDNPDLAPILSAVAGTREKKTTFIDAKRLKLKETDRLKAIALVLNKFGVKTETNEDGFTVTGRKEIEGGVIIDGMDDHRIIMMATLLGLTSLNGVTILSAEAVNKSYPEFFNDIIKLGGKIDVL